MQNDFKDSVKARLYDFKYTPFLSTYIFSWIYFNSKLILIFTSSKLSVANKIEMLSWTDVNYTTPLTFALIYVFIFPLATALFYATTLGYKALMNFIQQKIQDKTPLPQEQANIISKENLKLTLDLNTTISEIEKIKLEYNSKEQNLISDFAEKNKVLVEQLENRELKIELEIIERVKDKVKDLNNSLEKTYEAIEDRNTSINNNRLTIKSLETKVSELEAKIVKLEPITNEVIIIDNAYKKVKASKDPLISKLTTDQIKILATFFKNDAEMTIEFLKNYVNSEYNLSKPLVDSRIKELKKNNIIGTTQYHDYVITDIGKRILEVIFT